MPLSGKGRRNSGSAPMKKGSNRKAKRPRSLDEFYSDTYGERWPLLKVAMQAAPRKIALWNRFCQLPFDEVTQGMERVDSKSVSQAFRRQSSLSDGASQVLLEKPPLDEYNVKAYYLMDYASALIVEQLQVGAFDYVLDMCAAPGGKSVAIAQFLSPDGMLTANEAKADRCARLRRNLQEHVPTNFVPWKVSQRDAQSWHDPCAYNRVLVDAPCSSERHLLEQAAGSPVTLRQWSEETSAALSVLQRALVQRAIETCKVGGRVVYSTCSISPLENDGVVEEVLRRTRCDVEVVAPTGMCFGEPTTHGWLVLPDVADGWGPMYFCILHKVGEYRTHCESETDADDMQED